MTDALEPLPLPEPLPAAEPLPVAAEPLPLPLPLPLPEALPATAAVDPAAAAAAAVAANALRGRWLSEVREKTSTVAELLVAASTPEGAALRRIRLLKLLAAVYGTSAPAQQRRLEDFTRVADIRPVPSESEIAGFDVAWLLDSRTGGTRVWPFMDLLGDKRIAPWDGFPFAAAPQFAEPTSPNRVMSQVGAASNPSSVDVDGRSVAEVGGPRVGRQ